jgi:ATP-dependent Clp protease ATP-binding subunit ClpC
VLLDEIEKAHPDVFNILLQVLEDGRITDSQGRVVDFKNTIIIMTSNIGVRDIGPTTDIGFRSTKDEGTEEVQYERMKKKVIDETKKLFKPEFLNRLDELIVFSKLSKAEILEIVDLMMKRVKEEVEAQGRHIEYNDAAKERLGKDGFDPTYGARPLRRAIQRMVEDPLAEEFIRNTFKEGETVMVDADPDDEDKLVFYKKGDKPPKKSKAKEKEDGCSGRKNR